MRIEEETVTTTWISDIEREVPAGSFLVNNMSAVPRRFAPARVVIKTATRDSRSGPRAVVRVTGRIINSNGRLSPTTSQCEYAYVKGEDYIRNEFADMPPWLKDICKPYVIDTVSA